MEILQNAYQFIFSQWYWAFLFFLIFFSGLYGIGVFLSNALLRFLKQREIIYAIQNAKKEGQVKREIRQSFFSIFIFSLQAIPMQWLIQKGFLSVNFDWTWMILWEIPVLFLWNEFHFYAVHWLLHRKWFFKNVHYVHHLSKEPTVYSIYSFHWVEAFLLGTVIFFPLIFHSFNIISLLSLPLMSIILNLAGHCNYEPKSFIGKHGLFRFTYRHTMHHKYSKGNFGFMLNWFDLIFKTQLKNLHD